VCRTKIKCILPREIAVDDRLYVHCTIINRGNATLDPAFPHPVRISYKWRTPKGSMNGHDIIEGYRTELPAPLSPGGKTVCFAGIDTPMHEGKYELAVTLVQEHCAWFDDIHPANAFRKVVTVGKPKDGDVLTGIRNIVQDPRLWPAEAAWTAEAGIVIPRAAA